jgi:tryptophan 2,3-dioxygenase
MRGTLRKFYIIFNTKIFTKTIISSSFFQIMEYYQKERILGNKQNKIHQNCAKQQKHNNNVTNQNKKHREGKLSKSHIIAYRASFE